MAGVEELLLASTPLSLRLPHPRQLSQFRGLLCFARLMGLLLQNLIRPKPEVWRRADWESMEFPIRLVFPKRCGSGSRAPCPAHRSNRRRRWPGRVRMLLCALAAELEFRVYARGRCCTDLSEGVCVLQPLLTLLRQAGIFFPFNFQI